MKLLTSDEILSKVMELIDSTNKSLKIASAWIKGNNFHSILNKIKDRSIELEVILRTSELQDLIISDEHIFRKINEANGKIYLCSRLHAKFIISDDTKAILGSANFTDAGLSKIDIGNIEASVYYDKDDGEGHVDDLIAYFNSIKEQYSVRFDKDLIGFAFNPIKTKSFEFVLMNDSIGINSYVEVRLQNCIIIGRISDIYAYDTGFFANPFTSQESKVFAPFDDFKMIFSDKKEDDWKKAAVYAYVNSNGNRLKIANVEIIGVIEGDKLDMLRKPFNVGEAVYKISEETIKKVITKNSSGNKMNIPIEIGLLENSNYKVFLDIREVINKHMLIIGTTGSGKSHFAKKLLYKVSNIDNKIKLFIFDPHGEYLSVFNDKLGDIEHIEFEDTILPIYPDELEDIIKQAGYGSLISGNSKVVQSIKSMIAKAIKPSIHTTALSEQSLLEVLAIDNENTSDDLKNLTNYLETIYGNAVRNQKDIIKNIQTGIKSDKSVVIFNLKKITHPDTTTNIAGLIMQELFLKNKQIPSDTIVVLEEAHNFAPERGYSDNAGKDNLALMYAKKIASEGRKFNLGLIVITQRPAQVSKYILSQLNTQAMFRTINSNDIDIISTYIEYAGESIVNLLPSLPTGTGIISGLGVPFPIVVDVER